jgi:hypothetical protein
MRRWIASFASAGLLAVGLWACGGSSGTPASATAPTPTPAPTAAPTLTAVTVTGDAPSIGGTAQFSATASLSNGIIQTVTSQAAWQSSNGSVATVASGGLVTAIGAGEADISASYQNVSGQRHVSVARPTFTVSGMVVDTTSNSPLSGVQLTIVDGTNGGKSATSSNGNYALTGVLPGSFSVSATATGYNTNTRSVTITAADVRLDLGMARASSSPSPSPSPSPTPSPTPAPTPPVGAPGLPAKTSAGTCSLDAIVHPAACVNNMFGNASAICNDGARSCSTNSSGTCSTHEKVYCWVCPGPLCR